ncbi:MAG: acetoin utilization protein AcuC [Nitrososphaerales archaeon]
MPRPDGCRLGVSFGKESDLYSFPHPHPMNAARTVPFARWLGSAEGFELVAPVPATEEDLLLFHTPDYVSFVRESSRRGAGPLDGGDTPSFEGVYEASLYPVGNTLNGLRLVLEGGLDHFFNPVGGLHHAREGAAEGFCVFNDAAVAVCRALSTLGIGRVAYVDIDAHFGDGVFYGFEGDPRVIIGDVHEDGRFLFPGTGRTGETGRGEAAGTKLNLPLPPGAGDSEFVGAFQRVEELVRRSRPDLILLQCGADGLEGDPLTHLAYSPAAHAHATSRLHSLAHEVCGGRIIAMGGGGYEPANVLSAWSAVVRGLSENGMPRLPQG